MPHRKHEPPSPAEARTAVGWREWVALPELGIAAIKAKVDTGARTSALHAFRITHGPAAAHRLRFDIHPYPARPDIVVSCEAPIVDRRWIRDSGGHRELRYIIRTAVRLGPQTWPIEISLTDRESMRFRMLLGRTAMADRVVVFPDASYLTGRRA